MRIIGIECNFLKMSKNFFPPLLHTVYDLHRFRNSPSFPISCIWQCLIVWFPSSSSLVHCVYLLYSGGRVFDLWTPPVTHSSRSARGMSGRQSVKVPTRLIIKANALFETKWNERLHNVDKLNVAPEPVWRVSDTELLIGDWTKN